MYTCRELENSKDIYRDSVCNKLNKVLFLLRDIGPRCSFDDGRVGIEGILGALVLVRHVVALLARYELAAGERRQDDQQDNGCDDAADDGAGRRARRVEVVGDARRQRRRWTGFDHFGRVRLRLDAARVLSHFGSRRIGMDIITTILLKQSPQRKMVVEGDSTDASDKAVARVHRLVAANVNTLQTIELCIGFLANLKSVNNWFVLVNLLKNKD